MTKQKYFQWILKYGFTVFSCVLVAALGIVVISYGATTISTNIDTGGNLTVNSTSTLATTTISGYLDLNLNEIRNVALENLANFPSSPADGQMFWSTASSSPYWYTSSQWKGDVSGVAFVVAASDSKNKEKADYICDGTADDVEIQAAINALPSGGGKIILLEGIYSINATISLSSSNITLTGQGMYSTILKTETDIARIIYVTADNVVLKDLQLDGNDLSNCVGTDSDSDYIVLSGLYAKNSDSSHILDIGGKYNLVENGRFENSTDDCIAVGQTSQYTMVRNNFAMNCDGGSLSSGIEMDDGATDVVVMGNIVRDAGGASIDIHSHDGDLPVERVVITGNIADCIDVYWIDTPLGPHEDITISNNNTNAIRMEHCENCVIQGNTVTPSSPVAYATGSHGVYMDSDKNVAVTGNNVRYFRNNNYSIVGSEHIMLSGNVGFGAAGNGLTMTNSSYVTIMGNDFSDHATLPTSDIASDADSGQKDIVVDDVSDFIVGETLTVSDDSNSETNYISAIDSDTNTLTMENNLTNTYVAADNGAVTKDGQTRGISIGNTNDYITIIGNTAVNNTTWEQDISVSGVDHLILNNNHLLHNDNMGIYRGKTTDANGQIELTSSDLKIAYVTKPEVRVALESNNLWYIAAWSQDGSDLYDGFTIQVTATTSDPVGAGVTAHIFVGN